MLTVNVLLKHASLLLISHMINFLKHESVVHLESWYHKTYYLFILIFTKFLTFVRFKLDSFGGHDLH